jgi:hypothetical protein
MVSTDKRLVLTALIAGVCFCASVGYCTVHEWQKGEIQKACIQKTGKAWCER